MTHKITVTTTEDSPEEIAVAIRAMTKEMRSSEEAWWVEFRDKLEAKNVDIENCILLERIPCGNNGDDPFAVTDEYGALILVDRKVIEFEYSFKEFTAWVDVTNSHEPAEFNEEIAVGLQLFENGL